MRVWIFSCMVQHLFQCYLTLVNDSVIMFKISFIFHVELKAKCSTSACHCWGNTMANQNWNIFKPKFHNSFFFYMMSAKYTAFHVVSCRLSLYLWLLNTGCCCRLAEIVIGLMVHLWYLRGFWIHVWNRNIS